MQFSSAYLTRFELGPVIECIFYCFLPFESLVKCKMYLKSNPVEPRP